MNILILGDSHTRYFQARTNSRFKYTVCTVAGATAQGAVNPNSKTNALALFESHLKENTRHDYVCTMLGEVDCGFVIWYRASKHKVSIDSQIERSIANYADFLNKVASYYNPDRIIVLSAPLPTIKDNTNPNILSGARKEVTTPLGERTRLTHTYNEKLKQLCNKNGYKWIDVTKELLDPKTQVLHDKWRHPDPTDHHLNDKLAKKVYEIEMEKIIWSGYSY